jgi:hypothetical protein
LAGISASASLREPGPQIPLHVLDSLTHGPP